MKIFEKIGSLTKAGVVFHLTVRAAGENLQVELLPQCDNSKTGVKMAPRVFTGTAAEFDSEFESILETFSQSNVSLAQQADAAKLAMDAAQKEAAEAVKKAAETKKAVKPAAGSSALPTKSQRDLTSGLISPTGGNSSADPDDVSDGDDGDDDFGQSGVSAVGEAPTTGHKSITELF